MLHKQIKKWQEVFLKEYLSILSPCPDMYCYYRTEHPYDKEFTNAIANIVYSIENYYNIFEDGDEFKELKSGKRLDDVVDENLGELRELIKNFKKELIKREGGMMDE